MEVNTAKIFGNVFASRGLGYSAKEGSQQVIPDDQVACLRSCHLCILPVTFGNFTAEKQSNTALLKWTTASGI